MNKEQRQQVTTVEPGFVRVFPYVYWDEASQAHKNSTRFATFEVIRCGIGEPVDKSADKIASTKLIDGAFSQ